LSSIPPSTGIRNRNGSEDSKIRVARYDEAPGHGAATVPLVGDNSASRAAMRLDPAEPECPSGRALGSSGTVAAVASREERVNLALPPLDDRARGRAVDQDWEVNLLDPEDPDQRAILIRLAHPNLDEAIEAGSEEIEVGGQPMNPRLHLAIHEVVATQVIDDDPPEVFATLRRLVGAGRDRHEALHMLGSAIATQLWAVKHEQRPYDRTEHVRALHALPGSWDEQVDPRPVSGRRRLRRRRRRR
jgi:hypothetical protein